MQIYDPNQEAKSTCGDSQSKGRGMSENTKYYKNCQLFKAELVKMNWKFSKECLFALLFIMATALYKLPYTFFFCLHPDLSYFPWQILPELFNNNNLMCYMQIFLSTLHPHTQPSSLTANRMGIQHEVSLHKRCCFAFRQKRFYFFECHPETQEIRGKKEIHYHYDA